MTFGHDELLRLARFALACAPAIPLAFGLIGFGRSSREFAGTALAAGAIAALVGLATYLADLGLKHLLDGWPYVIVQGFALAAIPEEVAKYAVLTGIVVAHEDADIGIDIILGSAWVALGFATLENLLFVVAAKDSYQTGLIRAVLSVPWHVVLGVIMGCCLVMARQQRRWRVYWTEAALVVPIVLHGVFDCAALSRRLSPTTTMTSAAIIVLATLVILGAALIALWPLKVIGEFSMSRLADSGRPVGAPAPARRIERASRWIAVTVFGLAALLFLITGLVLWNRSSPAAPLGVAISALMLAFVLLFWRGPAKFKQRSAHLSGT